MQSSSKQGSTPNTPEPCNIDRLSVSPERQGVVSLPRLPPASSRLVVTMTLVETTRLLASGGEAARFAVLVNRVDNPVDARIATDGLVLRINEDDFVVLVGRVLVHPVRVENSQIRTAAADTLLCGSAEGPLILQLIDTLVGGFTICSSLRRRPFASTATNADSVDHITLLGLVAETAGLVWTRWARGAVDDVQLAVFPAADAE